MRESDNQFGLNKSKWKMPTPVTKIIERHNNCISHPCAMNALTTKKTNLQMLGSKLQLLGSKLHLLGSNLQLLGSKLQSLGSKLQLLGSILQLLGSKLQLLGLKLHLLVSNLQLLGSKLQLLGSNLRRWTICCIKFFLSGVQFYRTDNVVSKNRSKVSIFRSFVFQNNWSKCEGDSVGEEKSEGGGW